ncbi:MAG TPA: hypothetical protein VFK05_08720 [Polyangiaceae bacterium]|nr:hypothetical protein [Polyangiaceae bacterium]
MRGASHPSESVGSDAGGFKILSDADGNLRIAAWGYWPADVVRAFGESAPAAAQALLPLGMFVFDSSELKPQGSDGQEAIRMLFRVLADLPFAKGLIIKGNAMTCMQLARLLRECSAERRIEFTDAESLGS